MLRHNRSRPEKLMRFRLIHRQRIGPWQIRETCDLLPRAFNIVFAVNGIVLSEHAVHMNRRSGERQRNWIDSKYRAINLTQSVESRPVKRAVAQNLQCRVWISRTIRTREGVQKREAASIFINAINGAGIFGAAKVSRAIKRAIRAFDRRTGREITRRILRREFMEYPVTYAVAINAVEDSVIVEPTA